MFIRLVHRVGEDAQVDFFEIRVDAADGLRVRADWNLDAAVLTGLNTGDVVPVFGQSPSSQLIGEMDNYWYQVEAPDGVTGWAFGAFLDLHTRYETPGFAISVEEEISEGLTVSEIAAFSDGETGISWPRHLRVVFDGYPGRRVSELNRQMYVFATDPDATGATTTIVTGASERLRELLTGPLGSQINTTAADLRDAIPVVPQPPGAHQAFVASVRALPFEGGKGIRFLTQIVQDLIWPPSEAITYVYQGYTDDNSAYVSAWFQVQRPPVASDSQPRPARERILDGGRGRHHSTNLVTSRRPPTWTSPTCTDFLITLKLRTIMTKTVNHDHKFIETNGITLHVLCAGDLGDPLIVLLHGFPEFHLGWERQVDALVESGYFVMVPDQRGYNLSDMLRSIGAYTVDAIDQVRRIRLEFDHTVDEVQKRLPRNYTKELVETLFVHPYSRIEFLVDALGVERKAASRYLQALEELGLLFGQKGGRDKKQPWPLFLNTWQRPRSCSRRTSLRGPTSGYNGPNADRY